MPFKIGDQVVHPRHGIGTITKLANKQFEPGRVRAYYEITIGSSTVWVPVDEPALGLRQLGTRDDLRRCGPILESAPSDLDIAPHELRERLAKHLRDGSILAQCEVVRDLSALAWRRPLQGSMGEFQRAALGLLCQEWAIVAHIPIEQATLQVNDHLAKGRAAHQA